MQNTSTASHAGGTANHTWPNSGAIPNMYGTPVQGRSTSNPRAYTTPDMAGVSGEQRREDGQQQVLQDNGYAYQQGASYPGMSNVNYQYGSQGVGLPAYPAASPVNAHRRTSGHKPTSTPPASAPAATNPSPGARFYPTQQGTPDPNQSSMSAPSPYQPNSAPPQVASHQATSQPQTAHPYGGGYYNYYDHQQQGQWAQHYAQQGSFAQPAARAQPAATTTPQTAIPSDQASQQQQQQQQQQQHRSSQSGASPYDYNHYQGYNGGGHERASVPHTQHWPTPTTASNRYSMPGQGAPQAQQWQGYPHHPMPQAMHPQHMQGMMQGQYAGWQQQQWNAQGYYPPITPHSANQPALNASMTHAAKKDSKDYDGLGKRAVESGTEDEAEVDGKKKKGKKEKEKEKEEVVPKPPAKSHLHPPRQAQSMWQLFFTDELNKAKAAAASGDSPGGTPHHAKLNVAQIAKDAGVAYANLTPSQKQYYTDKVQESKDQYAKELLAWQATLTPEDIRVENAFRAQQRKEGKSRKGNLKDPNAPKKPLSAYFLFLKGIREDDALRARVWGEESETTKQSVLAAERWRSLTDEEKRPFLQQAEKDKQDYEAARKIYEEDAAARARGEDVPMRTYPEPAIEVPKPVIKEMQSSETIDQPPLTASPKDDIIKNEPMSGAAETMFGSFSHADVEPTPEQETPQMQMDHEPSIEIDGFHGFGDPLGNMDLSFPNVDDRNGGQDWGELTNLMGGDESKPTHTPVQTELVETADVSVAPTVDEAVKQTQVDIPIETTFPADELSVRDIAQQAEGEVAVPPTEPEVQLGEAEISANASGVPTEEVNEQPSELPPTVELSLPASVSSENDHIEPPAFQEQISSDSLFSDSAFKAEEEQVATFVPEVSIASDLAELPKEPSTDESKEEATEQSAFGNLLGDLKAPTAEKEEPPKAELPDVSADVPSDVTSQPAHDATVESPHEAIADTDSQGPLVDGI